MKKNVLILATGGTIASVRGSEGLVPGYDVDKLLDFVPHVRNFCKLSGQMIMNIDSSNMMPSDWAHIAHSIFDAYNSYDGFVITHGTDTMSYTAAALTYMLSGLNKPVILTGSQYPISQDNTDAVQNLSDALQFATEPIAGVFVVFDGKLISGPRAVKVKTRSYDAFESINFPFVGEIKHNTIQYKRFVIDSFRPQKSTPALHCEIDENIAVIKLFPGISSDIFTHVGTNYKAVVIESFGIGGVPFEQTNIANEVAKLVERGIIVLMTTQCLEEGVDFQVYEVGRRLPKHKLIYASDLTTEASIVKLMCALGRFESFPEIKTFIETQVQFDMHSDAFF